MRSGSPRLKRLGAQRLQELVQELLKGYVNNRNVDILGYLRREWLGGEVLAALRAGQRLARGEPLIHQENLNTVAISNGHRAHLLRSVIQALPLDRLPENLLEWRLKLDLGM